MSRSPSFVKATTEGVVRAPSEFSMTFGLPPSMTATLLFLWFGRSGTVDYFGQPVGSDFTAFWNAGRLANAGEASRAWNHAALNASIQATHGTSYEAAWLYPPVFLLVMALLATMPY